MTSLALAVLVALASIGVLFGYYAVCDLLHAWRHGVFDNDDDDV